MRGLVKRIWLRILIGIPLIAAGLAATVLPALALAGYVCAFAGIVVLGSAFLVVRDLLAYQGLYNAFLIHFRDELHRDGYEVELIDPAQLNALWPRMREIAKGSMGGDFGRGALSQENVRALARENGESGLGVFRGKGEKRTLAGFIVVVATDNRGVHTLPRSRRVTSLDIAAVYARGAVARGATLLLLKIYILGRLRANRNLRVTARPATKAAKRLLAKYKFQPSGANPEIWSLDREHLAK